MKYFPNVFLPDFPLASHYPRIPSNQKTDYLSLLFYAWFFIISSFQKTKYLFPILKPMLSISHNYFFLPFLIFYHNHVKYNLIIALDSHLVFHVYYEHFCSLGWLLSFIFRCNSPMAPSKFMKLEWIFINFIFPSCQLPQSTKSITYFV